MEKISRIRIACLFAIMPFGIFAHPGHGNENPLSPGHYIVNPSHFLPLALTVVAVLHAVSTYRSFRNQSKQIIN